ncbi:MAG: ATP-binding cassette domain-containing protein [Saprospiraceae bacterium]|nr:ATP-binding cassette domain-containing protein [Saprospiraceae bacterium]
MDILKIDKVVKTYDKHIAVNEVSFSMPEGVIFGLLGPNGAGKSSLIRMITTITRPDSGHIYFNGESLNSSHPEQIGYMPEERGLYKKMKVGDHLMYLAQLKGLSYTEAREEIRHWFVKLDITSWWNKKVEELSKGMQQKAQFISTVIHKPRLLILDEPFSGLDPVNAELLKNEIYELHKNGTSIIFSTHRMEQVEEICDKIVLINKGENVLYGAVKDIKQQFKENLFRIDFTEDQALLPDLRSLNIVEQTPQYVTLKITGNQESNVILRHLLDSGVPIRAFNEILPSLNEIFIRQVGESNIQQ